MAYYHEYLSHNKGDDAIRMKHSSAAIRAAYFHTDLGLFETAETELRTADNWLDALPDEKSVKWNRTDIQLLLANILRRVDRWEESQQAYELVINILDGLLAAEPDNTGYLIRQSNAMVNLCVVYKYQKKWEESLQTYQPFD